MDLSGAAVRALRRVQYLRGGAFSRCDVCGGGLCRPCRGNDVQSFCKCGKAVPLSSGIRQSKTAVCNVDSDGKRCLCAWKGAQQGKDHGDHHGKDRGLRNQGFYEYGSGDGAGGGGCESAVTCRILEEAPQIMIRSLPGPWYGRKRDFA